METDEGAAKIYTKTGDKGKTSLIGGLRVSKSHLRLEAYGTIDELNSVIGVLKTEITSELAGAGSRLAAGHATEAQALTTFLTTIQSDLFNVGSQLACEEPKIREKLPRVDESHVAVLESEIDRFTRELKPLKNFILPGGSRSSGFAHVARTVCRRAERLSVALSESGDGEVDEIVVQYVNRMSDYLFALARWMNHLLGIDEPIWSARQQGEKKS